MATSPDLGLPERFTWRRTLGGGGMGVAHLVFDQELQREVVLKQLTRLTATGWDRAQREATAMAALNHPNVVRVHELLRAGDVPCLVMEHVEGRSLAERIDDEGSLPVAEAVRITQALCEALAHAHAHGILHRDVKPGNVFLTRDGGVRLGDFGLAKLSGTSTALTRSGEMLGSPGYLSPEQVSDAKRVDARTDVYGLGATLYTMLTSEPVFAQAQSLNELLVQVVTAPPPDPRRRNSRVPAGLSRVCRRCLAKAPDDRYPSMGALAAALRDAQSGERRAIWPLAAGCAAALGLLGALATMESPGPVAPAPPTSAAAPAPTTSQLEPTAGSREPITISRDRRAYVAIFQGEDALAVGGGGQLELWQLRGREPVSRWQVSAESGEARGVSPGGTYLVTADRDLISLVRADGEVLAAHGFAEHEDDFYAEAAALVFESERGVLVGGDPRRLQRYALDRWEPEPCGPEFPASIRGLGRDAESGLIAVGWSRESDSGRAGLWLLNAELEHVGGWRADGGRLTALAAGAESGQWILGFQTGSIAICEPGSGAGVEEPWPSQPLRAPAESLPALHVELGAKVAHPTKVVDLVVSGQHLLSISDSNKVTVAELRVWDLARRELIGVALSWPGVDLEGLAISPSGARVAVVATEGVTVFETAHLVELARQRGWAPGRDALSPPQVEGADVR